jgi:hypothetical protein
LSRTQGLRREAWGGRRRHLGGGRGSTKLRARALTNGGSRRVVWLGLDYTTPWICLGLGWSNIRLCCVDVLRRGERERGMERQRRAGSLLSSSGASPPAAPNTNTLGAGLRVAQATARAGVRRSFPPCPQVRSGSTSSTPAACAPGMPGRACQRNSSG